jgi:hypothetical protein
VLICELDCDYVATGEVGFFPAGDTADAVFFRILGCNRLMEFNLVAFAISGDYGAC